MDVVMDVRPNSTRLKEALIRMISGLRKHSEGRNVLLMFEEDVGASVKIACDQHLESDAVILAKAADNSETRYVQDEVQFQRILCREMPRRSSPRKTESLGEFRVERKTKPANP